MYDMKKTKNRNIMKPETENQLEQKARVVLVSKGSSKSLQYESFVKQVSFNEARSEWVRE